MESVMTRYHVIVICTLLKFVFDRAGRWSEAAFKEPVFCGWGYGTVCSDCVLCRQYNVRFNIRGLVVQHLLT